MRDQFGYYPDHLGTDDRIVWGTALKSSIQIEMEKNGAYYLEKGKDLVGSGMISAILEDKRILME